MNAGLYSSCRNNFSVSPQRISLRFLAEFMRPLAVSWVIVLCLTSQTRAGMGQIPLPFTLSADTISPGRVGVSTTIHLTITPNVPCKEITLEVVEADHLTYPGPASMKVTATQGKPTKFSLKVVIPANDTSGFLFEISGGERGQADKIYWVTVGDSVVSYRGNPRLYPPPGEGRDPKAPGPAMSYVEKPIPRTSVYDSTGYLISMEYGRSACGTELTPAELEIRARLTRDAAQMIALGQEPLPTQSEQVFVLAGEIWLRHQGEKGFRKLDTSSQKELRRWTDSLLRQGVSTDFDVILDLRVAEACDSAAKIVRTLTPLEPDGYFRALVSNMVLIRLYQQGIRYMPYPQMPSEERPDSLGRELPVLPENHIGDHQ